jgi:hypothetical protein
MGVVADDVTPVLFQFNGTATNYTIQITHNATNYNGLLSSHLFVLQNGAWTQTTNLTISSSSAPAFAYLSGLTWTDFSGTPANGVTVTIAVNVNLGSVATTVANTNFLVRPPPIALVHGIADDGTAWSYAFTNELAKYEPPDFIIPITYGRGAGQKEFPNANSWPNAYGALNALSVMLDDSLQQQLETPLQAKWAFTRYDAVGHSQGGVLLRMLCQTNIIGQGAFTYGSIPVVSQQNAYRGRFRRIVTIGSPQNGTLIGWYVHQVDDSIANADIGWFSQMQLGLFNIMAAIAPNKFDPFGSSIANINNGSLYPIDGRIKFNCIQTAIGNGGPPVQTLIPGIAPNSYYISGLCFPTKISGQSRGQVIIPDGSDGVVDYDSEGAGSGTPRTQITDNNIAHADVSALFGVPAGQSQTTYPEVADTVGSLLNGPTARFGSFILPSQLSSATEQNYLNTLSLGTLVMNIINLLPMPAISTTNINYSLQVPNSNPIAGSVSWYAQVFGTNGISTTGVSWQVNTNNSTLVTVSVTGGTQGTVVLYASYYDTNGDLVIANPLVVASDVVSANLNSILLNPGSAIMSSGDVLPTSVWGNYPNGTSTLLYIPAGQAQYASSNPNVASVDGNGKITMNTNGTAKITVSYQGLTAQAVVSTKDPFIILQPQNTNAPVGFTAALSVTANGTSSLGYQWLFNGTNIVGGTNSILLLSNCQLTNTGSYSVVVSDMFGIVTSSVAILSIFANKVSNGGFETGDFIGWTLTGDNAYTYVDKGPVFPPHSGNYEAVLGEDNSLGYLSQTLATTPGTSYVLSCWLDNSYADPGNIFSISWNGITLLNETNPVATSWTNYQFVVTATGASTVLQFSYMDIGANYLGLDDVRCASPACCSSQEWFRCRKNYI